MGKELFDDYVSEDFTLPIERPNIPSKKGYTNQELFDTISKHLLTQKKESIVDNRCFYRYEHLKCAVGAIIPDYLYNPTIENTAISSLLEQPFQQEMGIEELKQIFNTMGIRQSQYSLLSDLQTIHDTNPVLTWPLHLKYIALKYQLDPSVVYEYGW